MEIPHSSFLRVGLQLAREAEMDPIINIFLDNGYTLQFTRDILESLTSEQINYFLENISKLKKKLEISKEDIIHFLTSVKVGVKGKSKTPSVSRRLISERKIDTSMISEPKFIPYHTRKQEKIDMITMMAEENKILKCLRQQHKGQVEESFRDLSFLRELTPGEIEKAHIALFDFLQTVISDKNFLPDILHKVEQCVGECSVSYLTLSGVDGPTKRIIKRILSLPFLCWVNKSKTPNEKVQKIVHRISCFGEYFGERLKNEPSFKPKIKRGGNETRKIN